MQLFPTFPGLSWGVSRKPIWNNRAQKTASGRRTVVEYSSYPMYLWTLRFNVLRQYSTLTEMEELLGFFNQMRGIADLFLYKDIADYNCTNEPFGTGDGTTKKFQLQRAFGGHTEPVYAPKVGLSIRKAGVVQASGYTVSETGLVEFATAPANGAALDWTGEFYFRCAFTQDSMELINQEGEGIWKSNAISFESIKP